MSAQHMQIGEVATRTGLSLRSIRYYEEVGLVLPSMRSTGGFRLYTDEDVARLELVKRMKPLDFSLEDMRGLLEVADALEVETDDEERRRLLERLTGFQDAAEERVDTLRRRLRVAEEFAAGLVDRFEGQRSPVARS